MSVGSLGEIVFEASAEKIRTIDNVRRKGTARWATHEVIGRKPVREFIGPGLEAISFSMQFSVAFGVNPETEMKALRKMRDEGKAAELILGGVPLGDGLWTIDDITENQKRFDNKGNVLFAEVEVNLTEYPKDDEAKTVAATDETTNSDGTVVSTSETGESTESEEAMA